MPEENIKIGRIAVVDASFILSYLIPDEKRVTVNQIFDLYKERKINFMSSCLLSFEVYNSIKMACVRRRISLNLARKLINLFNEIEIKIMPVNFKKVFSLSIKKDLTIYDTAYLYLARLEKVELLTLDQKLSEYSKVKL